MIFIFIFFKDGVYALEKEVEMGAHLAEIKEEDVGDLSNLHKRWFDNMKEYMDRKEIRQKNEQIRSKKQFNFLLRVVE